MTLQEFLLESLQALDVSGTGVPEQGTSAKHLWTQGPKAGSEKEGRRREGVVEQEA